MTPLSLYSISHVLVFGFVLVAFGLYLAALYVYFYGGHKATLRTTREPIRNGTRPAPRTGFQA